MVDQLRGEIYRSEEFRYAHRLHAVILVAQGMSARQAGYHLGDSARTVAEWVRRFRKSGFDGLKEQPSPGRPSKLREDQIEEIRNRLHVAGQPLDGKALSEWIACRYNVRLQVRQCQRLIRQLLRCGDTG